MSTSSCLTYADDFKLFKEMLEEGEDVYLELRGADLEYSASPDSVTIRIPAAIWETIRKIPAVTFTYADKTDADLLAIIEKDVDERIAELKAATTEQQKALVSFCGSAIYDSADEPREVQVAAGLEHFQKVRAYEQSVWAKMITHNTRVGQDE